MSNIWNRPLIKKYGKVMAFKDLPMGAKMAMAWYMAVDGEAWALPKNWTRGGNGEWSEKLQEHAKKQLAKNMDYFDKEYGKKKFGLAMVPREEVEAIMFKGLQWRAKSEGAPSYTSFSAWLKAYTEDYSGGIPNHKTADYPSIFGDFKDDLLLQDGWHRFACYCKKKVKVLPFIYYLK